MRSSNVEDIAETGAGALACQFLEDSCAWPSGLLGSNAHAGQIQAQLEEVLCVLE